MTLGMHRFALCATILCLLAGCEGEHHDGKDRGPITFIQLTDPHLFLDTSKDSDATKKATRIAQEKLDQDAISDAWKSIGEITASGGSPSFVVITGDLGVEPCSIADLPVSSGSKITSGSKTASASEITSESKMTVKDCLDEVSKDKRTAQIAMLADKLGASPIRDIYLVPGNNDIPLETAGDDGLTYFDKLINEVQGKIHSDKKNVELHNLSRCYLSGGDPAGCYFDIPHTVYRMIGFPSYSFKNAEDGSEANPPLQEKQIDTFQGLLNQSEEAGKKILIVSHVPLMDDPYIVGQNRFAAIDPRSAIKDADIARPKWSTWNVSKKVTDTWEEAIADEAVVAIFAGHLHDSHKEIYQRPFSWSSVNDPKNGFGKLYLAPPLSVKNQDASPIQARGLAKVQLAGDEIGYRIYWYKADGGSFTPALARMPEWSEHREHQKWHGWPRVDGAILWLWRLADPQQNLNRMAVLLIAFLAAFLTVVQIWQIPPPEIPSKSKNSSGDVKADSSDGSKAESSKSDGSKLTFDPSPFASNFGKTVITGLGGLAAAVVVKALDSGSDSADKSDNKFYIVWFVILFFVFLIVGALLRAFGEALRERLTIRHPKPDGPYFKRDGDGNVSGKDWLLGWFKYLCSRIGQWFLSLRQPALTFLDTSINLIQGKNQTLTRAFSSTIVRQQKNIVCVAEVMRQQLNEMILEYVNTHSSRKVNGETQSVEHVANNSQPNLGSAKPDPNAKPDSNSAEPDCSRDKTDRSLRGLNDIRVSISVLSEDGKSVFYIARSPGSNRRAFPTRSLAWVSVFSGKIRWYRKAYENEEKQIILLDNTTDLMPDPAGTVYLGTYYQERQDDYEAFIILPVPWPSRSSGSGMTKGAIHISFRKQEDFDLIWPSKNDPVTKTQKYSSDEKMLWEWCASPQIRLVLRQSVAMLGQLLCGFNESIYKNSVTSNDCC